MSPACLNIVGLLLALLGSLLLFRYGMPYRVRTGVGLGVVLGQKDEAEQRAKKWDDSLGWIGLMLVVLGTLFIPVFIQ
jgi:hypothetical protein